MFYRCYFLLFKRRPLSFANGWTDRYTDCCVNADDKKAKNSVNFGPVTHEIVWLICMGGDCREANIRTVLVTGHPLGGSSIASL